ncbi:MAG TPA: FecR domain-containing protein, partial [Hanamia sp.]|nr:FecR domain-containing protein [Hanamia sp.]
MISDRILQLLAKQMGNAASEKELLELKQLLQQYPENHFFIEILQSIKSERSYSEPVLNEDELVQESWLMLSSELEDLDTTGSIPINKNEGNHKKSSVRVWMRNAAIWTGAVMLVGSSYFIWKQPSKKHTQPIATRINQVIVPYGAPEKKVLPDSTIVWINAGSHIHYAEDFVQKTRDVYLEGEAYFSVKHDADHPFIVHAGNVTVRALGTKFNVRAYQNENKIEATLISGKIQVNIEDKPDKNIILIPNEKLTVTNEKLKFANTQTQVRKELSFEVKEVEQMPSISAVREVAWLQDKLAFENESFDDLAKRMERRYDVHLIFKSSSLRDERLSGVFENENIQKALNLLQMTTDFHYQIRADTVFLNR